MKMEKPAIYVTRVLPAPAMERLTQETDARVWTEDRPVPREVLLQAVRTVQGLLILVTDSVDETVLAAAPELRVVSTMAVGYDNIDVPAAHRRGIPVGHTPGVLTETTADLAFALILACGRRLTESARFVQDSQWRHWAPLLLAGQDVHHATLGIVGLGRIGREVAKRAAGFDMRILYASHTRDPEAEARLQLAHRSLPDLLAESDFVSLHVPLTAETRYLIGDRELARMKPTAYLINTTRGQVVNQAALTAALRAGTIAGAGLDVTDPEPIDPGDPLLALPNAIVLPHVGSATIATRTRMALLAVENLLAGLAGKPLLHAVP